MSRAGAAGKRLLAHVGLLFACLWAGSAWAAENSAGPAERIPERIAVDATASLHRGEFNGQSVDYRALVERHAFLDAAGQEQATLITTSYLRTGVDPAQRPVLFLFNGGPGASTTPLHFDAFGPWLRMGPSDGRYLVPNPDSPLDTMDLVFIDPVGTGYSRALADDHAFWTVEGDARSVGQVIAAWLERHGRGASPRYLLGQSYGTVRAPQVLVQMPDLEVDGVALFALVGGRTHPIFQSMALLPGYATSAHAHGKGAHTHQPVRDVYAEAVEFARNDYLRALVEGGSLAADDRDRIARRMADFTGLPYERILEVDLRPSRRDFMFGLLSGEGLRTGQLDSRATRSLDAPPARPPYDDPGLGYAPEASVAPPAPEDAIRDRDGVAVVDRYYREVLGFNAGTDYIALNLDVNMAFQQSGMQLADMADEGLRTLAMRMQAMPRLRVLWVAGLYDLTTPAYGGRFALDQAGIPGDRLTAAYFESGHSVYVERANRAALAAQLREFTVPGPAPQDQGAP